MASGERLAWQAEFVLQSVVAQRSFYFVLFVFFAVKMNKDDGIVSLQPNLENYFSGSDFPSNSRLLATCTTPRIFVGC